MQNAFVGLVRSASMFMYRLLMGGALLAICLLGPRTSTVAAASLSEILAGRIGFWDSQTRYCVAGNIPPFPGKENPDRPETCDDQDMTLFNGLLCSVADKRGCDAVKRAQGPDGRWWRSPRLVGIDRTHGGAAASMSEEQTWGVFLYLLQTRDKEAFQKWINWISNESRPCWIKFGKICRAFGLPQWCTDTNVFGACNFLPFECVLFDYFARLLHEDPDAVSGRIGCDLILKITEAVVPIYSVQAQVKAQAIVTSASSYYAIHKIGVQIYLLQQLGLDDGYLRDAAARISNLPESAGNAFLLYLKAGRTDQVVDTVLKECPNPNQKQPAVRYQWLWERAKTDPTRSNSSYWDCIFAAKLMISNTDGQPEVVKAMQFAQEEAVRSVYGPCTGMQLLATATAQSSPSTDDYQVRFTETSSSPSPPRRLWYFNNTFVAPCSGKYSALISASASDATALDLVSTFRYGQPFGTLIISGPNTSTAKTFYLEQYEAVSLVLRRGQTTASIADAQLTITWCKNQKEAESCE
jgi:hypothetical protein